MLHRLCLIDVGNLLAEIARTGMYYKVNIALIVLVKLDEMVAAAKRSDCLVDTCGVLDFAIAVKFGHKLLCLTVYLHFLADKRFETETVLAHNHPRRHIATDMLVKCVIINS